MARFKGPIFPSWRDQQRTDPVTVAKARAAVIDREREAGTRLPYRALPVGHTWIGHSGRKANERRLRQSARQEEKRQRRAVAVLERGAVECLVCGASDATEPQYTRGVYDGRVCRSCAAAGAGRENVEIPEQNLKN